MITDFRNYTNAGLRNITFNGKNSLKNFGILLTTDTQTESITARSDQTVIPYRQGVLDSSRQDGELYYDARKLVYCFKILAETPQELKEKAANVKKWLTSSGTFEIYDSDYGSEWKFTNCILKSIEARNGEKTSVPYMYLTANFDADPKMMQAGARKTRLYSFAAVGNAKFAVFNGTSYVSRVISLPWYAVPEVSMHTVTVDLPETAVTTKPSTFHIFDPSDDAKSASAYIFRNGEAVPNSVTMSSSKQGTIMGINSGDKLVIYYKDDAPDILLIAGTLSEKTYSRYTEYDLLYRIKAYAEQTPSLKINGKTADITKQFSFSSEECLIEIQNSGYGYYEFMLDTGEERL